MLKRLGVLFTIVLILYPIVGKSLSNSPLPEIALIQQNSLLPISEPVYQDSIEIEREKAINKVLALIIQRESSGRPNVCNKKYGCASGMGLTQLIPSTIHYCEEKLQKRINPFNPDDNLMCARWLLENEGTKHWDKFTGPYPEIPK